MLAYLSRYTHRLAIANSRLIACDVETVTFKWKDYRSEGRECHKTMSLAVPEFIRRSLIHVLPKGFHRIRHYGLFNNTTRADNITHIRALLRVHLAQPQSDNSDTDEPQLLSYPCPCCGGRMIIIETFGRGCVPTALVPVDTL